MDEAQRNTQLVLDAYSGRPGDRGRVHADGKYLPFRADLSTFHGRDDVVQRLFAVVGVVLASVRMIPVKAVAKCDQVVVEFQGQGRTKDGRDYNNRYCSVFRVSNGRITHVREYLGTDLTRSVFV